MAGPRPLVIVIAGGRRRGLARFFRLYLQIASSWQVFDNSHVGRPRLIAEGRGDRPERVANPPTWRRITKAYHEQS